MSRIQLTNSAQQSKPVVQFDCRDRSVAAARTLSDQFGKLHKESRLISLDHEIRQNHFCHGCCFLACGLPRPDFLAAGGSSFRQSDCADAGYRMRPFTCSPISHSDTDDRAKPFRFAVASFCVPNAKSSFSVKEASEPCKISFHSASYERLNHVRRKTGRLLDGPVCDSVNVEPAVKPSVAGETDDFQTSSSAGATHGVEGRTFRFTDDQLQLSCQNHPRILLHLATLREVG
jgi:hypothetical protein